MLKVWSGVLVQSSMIQCLIQNDFQYCFPTFLGVYLLSLQNSQRYFLWERGLAYV